MYELTIIVSVLLSLILYALTGGADFGGGMWDLLACGPRKERQRKAIAAALSPIWEANHVWLILVIVVLFTAFPAAFAALMTALHIPITLMLVGIVLRGSAFIFRKYDSQGEGVRQRWGILFGAACFFTPLTQGMVLGALATGQIRCVGTQVTTGFFAGWLTPFAWACGLFGIVQCGFLSAIYLTLYTRAEPDLQHDFRRRALGSGLALVPLGLVVFLTSKEGAPELLRAMKQGWAPLLLAGGSLCALAALLALWQRRFFLARRAAVGQVALLLTSWGCAQYPHVIIPGVTFHQSAAPEATLRLLTFALGAGAVLLFPALLFLYQLFSRPQTNQDTDHES